MRKYINYNKVLSVVLFAGLMIVLFTACADGGGDNESDAALEPQNQEQPDVEQPQETEPQDLELQDVEQQDVPAEPQPFSFEKDMGIEIDGTWFPIWQDASGLIAALGDDYELYAAPSCVFDEGDDKEFAYAGINIYTNPDGPRDLWYCAYLHGSDYSTSRSITVGNTLEEVTAVYGDGFYWEGEATLIYSVSGVQGDISSPNIQFTVSDGTVTDIEIYYPTNTT